MYGMMTLGIAVSLKNMLTGPAQQVVKSLKNIENASNFGSKLRKTGAELTAFGALNASIVGGMKSRGMDLVQPFFELEDGLAAVRTISTGTFGSVDTDIEQVTNRAKSWGRKHTGAALSARRTCRAPDELKTAASAR